MTMHGLGSYHEIRENEKTMYCVPLLLFKQGTQNKITIQPMIPHF